MFRKKVVVDAKGHLLGRLASIIAKELLNGQKVAVVRCEEINISGSLYRNKLKYQKFLRLRMNSNPRRGPFHFRAPSKILWRTIRGMIPHKTSRGQAALKRLQVFDGVPTAFNNKKRMIVSDALKTIRLKPGRKFCNLGELSKEVGWKYGETLKELEDKRKATATENYKMKLKTRAKFDQKKKEVTQSNPEWKSVLKSYYCA